MKSKAKRHNSRTVIPIYYVSVLMHFVMRPVPCRCCGHTFCHESDCSYYYHLILDLCVCVCVRARACVCMCVYGYACVRVCISVCNNVCMFVVDYVCFSLVLIMNQLNQCALPGDQFAFGRWRFRRTKSVV